MLDSSDQFHHDFDEYIEFQDSLIRYVPWKSQNKFVQSTLACGMILE